MKCALWAPFTHHAFTHAPKNQVVDQLLANPESYPKLKGAGIGEEDDVMVVGFSPSKRSKVRMYVCACVCLCLYVDQLRAAGYACMSVHVCARGDVYPNASH